MNSRMITRQLGIMYVLAFLAMPGLLWSCGTEIGNGFKPGGDEETKKKSEQPMSAGDNQSASPDANVEDDLVGSDGAAEDDEFEVPADATVGGDLPLDENILLNGCASPFAMAAEDSKIKIYNGDTVLFDGVYAEGYWTLTDSNEDVLVVAPTDDQNPFDVTVTDDESNEVESKYTCTGSVSVVDNQELDGLKELTEYRTLLKDENDQIFGLSWLYSEGEKKLVAITVTSGDKDELVLAVEQQ